MYLVAIGWMYVVLMMAAAELASPSGTWLGALVTMILYGILPVSLVLYLLATPMRGRARRRREASADATVETASTDEPDAGRHSAGRPVASVGKKA